MRKLAIVGVAYSLGIRESWVPVLQSRYQHLTLSPCRRLRNRYRYEQHDGNASQVFDGRLRLCFSLFSSQQVRKSESLPIGCGVHHKLTKKAVLPQGNHAMPQVFFSVEVRQQHSLQV